MHRSHRAPYGGSKIGIIFAACCVVVIVALAMFSVQMLQMDHAGGYLRLKDGTYVTQLNQSWEIMSRDFDGVFPTPGLADRLPVDVDGRSTKVPGRGEENLAANTTANLYSMSIMQNYFTPEICVGPTEPSANVEVHDDYDWEAYDPIQAEHWDRSFVADLDDLSHVSYAHIPLHGRRIREWSPDRSPALAIVSNRGPLGGREDPDSLTYQIHDPEKTWAGNVCYEDGRLEFVETLAPNGSDNLFAFDDGIDGGDSILSFTRAMNENGPVVQHD